ARPAMTGYYFSHEQFVRLASVQDAFVGVAAYGKLARVFSTEDSVDQVVVQFVTGRYFDVLGVRPALGRLIAPDDDVAGGQLVAVLSHQFWRSRFGGNTDVLDAVFRLSGQEVRVVGVAPREFEDF